MSFVRTLFALLWLVLVSCSQQRSPGQPEERKSLDGWPKDWSACLGQSVTVEGTAINMKLGAIVSRDGAHIWIDGLWEWPSGYYLGGDEGKRVRVTGTVIQRHDLPVFVRKAGEPLIAGIPVPEGTNLYEASRRFLLKDAKWSLTK